MFIEKKTLAILALTVSAIGLLVLNFHDPKPAVAGEVINGRDYQLVTGRVTNGGEALYILDNRTGLLAVFTYDVNVQRVRPRAFTAIADVFPK